MKVAIISNWDIRCGNAQYARDLRDELSKEFTVVSLPGVVSYAKHSLDEIRLAIVNWHPSRVTVTAQDIRDIRSRGVKTILLIQNSFEHTLQTTEDDIVMESDAVVAHEPMRFDGPKPNFYHIQHGIPEVKGLPEPYGGRWVGTAGFAFPWKRFDVVAEAAKKFNARCRIISSQSDQMDTTSFLNGIAGHIGPLADIHKDWLPVENVVKMLAECTANIFWFNSYNLEDQLGQSGSVRFGIAARRPTIISTHKKLKTLFPYQDELYICEREEQVYESLQAIFDNPEKAKKPNRILEDMGWNTIGAQYRWLVRSLVGVS